MTSVDDSVVEDTTQETNYGSVSEPPVEEVENPKEVTKSIFSRLWWLILLGILATIVAQLIFLPRTSPNRDFRRWHGLKLTRSDVERLFISLLRPGKSDSEGFTTEDRIGMYLRNFSEINSQSATNMAGSENRNLEEFVEKEMRRQKCETHIYDYDLPVELQAPADLSLVLRDAENNRVLYKAPLKELNFHTPAFFCFSAAGQIKKDYVNANMGTPADYALLDKNGISIENRIVIFSHALDSEYSLNDKIHFAEGIGCAGVIVYGDENVPKTISRKFRSHSIPTLSFRLPISFDSVKPILVALGPSYGDFKEWQFAPYSNHALQLELGTQFNQSPLRGSTIVSTMNSAMHDGIVVVGASRDSLTSTNPLSGHAIMIELMSQLSELQRLGWLPLRTIKFVSWDASRSGAFGMSDLLDRVLPKSSPVLAYINLDEDVIMGDRFSVDSNPLFNDILKYAARFVTLLANSKERKLPTPQNPHLQVDSVTTLLELWMKQSNATVNNKLGYLLAGKAAGNIQFVRQVPTINLKFETCKIKKDLFYVPDSNSYSYHWVEQNDEGLRLHGALLRYLGLLLISLGENEVVESKVGLLFGKIDEYFTSMSSSYNILNNAWSREDVSDIFMDHAPQSVLFADAKAKKLSEHISNASVHYNVVFETFKDLVHKLAAKALKFDAYAEEVEDLWTTDFPWFKLPQKILIYLKFKQLNWKLLRIEQVLASDSLNSSGDFKHLMYDIPRGMLPMSEKNERGAFAAFYEAYDSGLMEQVVLLMAEKYERLKTALDYIT